MTDPFGNYLAQKLIEVFSKQGNRNHLMKIVKSVKEGIVELCTGMHGTRSMQKLIEFVAADKFAAHRIALASTLAPKVKVLAHEINGNHVLFKLLATWPHSDK